MSASEFLEPLSRTFFWMHSLRDLSQGGAIICPEHGVEHTGKSANMCILGLELFRHTGDDRFAQGAIEQGHRLLKRLEREGDSPCFTFRPGRHDPYNCSNSVIDGGACSDALASLVADADALGLDANTRHDFALASLRHAQSYLRYAAVDKGIPAQRAWGLTGLVAGSAFAEELAEEAFEQFEGCTAPAEWPAALRAAAEKSLDILREIQSSDGSFPYHPHSWGPGHPGAADASSFYQSRVTGFVLHAVEHLGDSPTSDRHREGLRSGLDFLLGLSGPSGVKVGLVEAKPWYWGATYEVASHVFDAHALASGWRIFGDHKYAVGALASFRSWASHLKPSGQPTSHFPGAGRCPSYQCPVFWASHAAWLARALGELTAIKKLELNGELKPQEYRGVTHYSDCGLTRLEGQHHVAWIRGERPPGNVNHGSVHGAGLLRLVRKGVVDPARCAEECVGRERFGSAKESEWTGSAGSFSLKRGWAAGKDELRFALWTSRIHWRAGRRLDCLLELPRVFRRAVWAYAKADVSSAFCRAPQVEVGDDSVTLRSTLAWRDGTPVPGTAFVRVFRMSSAGLEVTESADMRANVNGIIYEVPDSAVNGPRTVQETGTEFSYLLT